MALAGRAGLRDDDDSTTARRMVRRQGAYPHDLPKGLDFPYLFKAAPPAPHRAALMQPQALARGRAASGRSPHGARLQPETPRPAYYFANPEPVAAGVLLAAGCLRWMALLLPRIERLGRK